MEDEVLEQEQVVETPVEEPVVDTEVEQPVEPVAEPVEETPVVEEPVEEPVVAEPAPEPIQVYTKGKWEDLEVLTDKEMEVGKTYRIKVSGHCQFSVSAEKPIAGIATNEITFTKQDGLKLWIKTGE
ncbi:MAG: hypothetical protein II453_10975 [Alphaproteobacteria bacterium]|nr:hypothetical protein [Alphaproteobacteria bacterium]